MEWDDGVWSWKSGGFSGTDEMTGDGGMCRVGVVGIQWDRGRVLGGFKWLVGWKADEGVGRMEGKRSYCWFENDD